MKSILSPTDFSQAGNNAVHYAFRLAIKLQSKLLLTNSIQFPMPIVTPAGAEIPLINENELEDLARTELSILADTLRHEKQSDNENLSGLPEIECSTGIGPAYVNISDLVKNKNADMVVMGLSGTGLLKRFFMGSTSRDLINAATFPVLLIPDSYIFSDIKNIVFATDLHPTDLSIIKGLTRLAKSLNAKINIINVRTDNREEVLARKEKFLAVLETHLSDSEIPFHDIYNRSEESGIDSYLENNHVDWLVLIHRQHTFMDNLLKAPHSHKITQHASVPILVLPEKMNVTF